MMPKRSAVLQRAATAYCIGRCEAFQQADTHVCTGWAFHSDGST
jgi:LDH2 family malate/lactate/ureidoglycolate dehydrogenase